MSFERLAELLFPDVERDADDYERLYPERKLPEGAKVTRIAPSPTGFIHLGNLYGALTDERLAHQSGGIFFLRIEDTDAKREVANGAEMIRACLRSFGLVFDEGALEGGDRGAYGPYRQRERAHIYHAFAKKLVLEGKAYPCFCSEEELAEMRAEQEREKVNFGYYGKWAKYRDLPFDEAERRIRAGEPYVLRFRSEGDPSHYLHLTDQIRGKIDMPENDQDFVLLKSDGIPTYHFAHVVDDHLMRVTHVVRGEEWLATWPIHVQLFAALGWKCPKYCHTAHLMKAEGSGKRKLSKRKDPELALSFYRENGYPSESVREYLMTLLNSNFEEWRLANPKADIDAFPFALSKMGVSGALFDLDKLRDVSKNVVAAMTAQQVYDAVWRLGARIRPAVLRAAGRRPRLCDPCPVHRPRRQKAAQGHRALVGRQAVYEPVLRWAVHALGTDAAGLCFRRREEGACALLRDLRRERYAGAVVRQAQGGRGGAGLRARGQAVQAVARALSGPCGRREHVRPHCADRPQQLA